MEVFSGKFPHLHTQSECRCPGSHPRVHPLIQRYCIPNGADDTTNDRVLRLDVEAHPLYYINDDDIGTTWISSVFANTAGLDHGVSITIDLQNGQYQVMRRLHLLFIKSKLGEDFCRHFNFEEIQNLCFKMLSLEDQEENFLFPYEKMQKATECIMVLVIAF